MPTEDRIEDKHESFGLVGFSRVTGHTNLFGSSIDVGSFIALRIKRATRVRDLNTYWYHGSKEIVEVYMSANQFAELLTSMNVGDGVPCTIKYVEGKRMEECPTVDQRETFEREFSGKVASVMADAKKLVKEVEQMFGSKASINKGDREAILEKLRMLMQNINSNMPFVQSQFNEAMDKTVTEAKAEVEGFVESKIRALGIDALNTEVGRALAATSQSPALQIESKEVK